MHSWIFNNSITHSYQLLLQGTDPMAFFPSPGKAPYMTKNSQTHSEIQIYQPCNCCRTCLLWSNLESGPGGRFTELPNISKPRMVDMDRANQSFRKHKSREDWRQLESTAVEAINAYYKILYINGTNQYVPIILSSKKMDSGNRRERGWLTCHICPGQNRTRDVADMCLNL